MKILFVGSKMQGYFIAEECHKNNWQLDYVETIENMDLLNYETDILSQSVKGYDYIVYDVSMCITEAELLAYTISQIARSTNAVPVVIVNTLNSKNVVVAALLNKNIRSFINKGSGTATDFKEQFVKNVSGYYENNKREDVTNIEKEIERKVQSIKNTKTVGVAGVCRRIGTSTQTIQMAKYITLKGYKACVVEINNVKYTTTLNKYNGSTTELSYFEKIAMYCKTDILDKELGFFRKENVDVYYKPEKLNEIREKEYDYIIFDYGVYTANAFNKTAFLKDDEIYFVAGNDIVEIEKLVDILDISSYNDSKLIFSFVNEKDRIDMENFLEEIDKKRKCYFSEFAPDPFILSNTNMLDDMFNLEDKNEKKEHQDKKKKFGLFGKKK